MNGGVEGDDGEEGSRRFFFVMSMRSHRHEQAASGATPKEEKIVSASGIDERQFVYEEHGVGCREREAVSGATSEEEHDVRRREQRRSAV